MRGAIPPLPNAPSWRGAQLKHRNNFTFTLVPYKHGNNINRVIKRRRVIRSRHVERVGEMKNEQRILVGKLNGRHYLEDRHRWDENIRMDLRETGWEFKD
jgi:hypothetical protein